jgi:Tol biopolymer transport system component
VLYLTFDEAGQQELAMVNLGTGETITVTDTPFGVWDYAPVPGGNAVIYAAIREDGGSDLWQVNLQTQAHQILLNCPSAACNGVAWQPNRQRFIYERRNILAENGGPGPPRLWWYDVPSGDTLSVFADSQLLGYGANWSPDGAWLGFVVPVAQEVRLVNLETGDTQVIPNRVGEPPVWSTQENVALVTDLQQAGEGFAVHLLKVDPVSEQVENLSGPEAQVEDDSARWSPDGAGIVFTRKPPRASMGKQLWLMRADGSEARTLTEAAEIHHGVPQWSPDGRYLVYQTFRLKEIGGRPAIWLYDLARDGSQALAQPGNRPLWIP